MKKLLIVLLCLLLTVSLRPRRNGRRKLYVSGIGRVRSKLSAGRILRTGDRLRLYAL